MHEYSIFELVFPFIAFGISLSASAFFVFHHIVKRSRFSRIVLITSLLSSVYIFFAIMLVTYAVFLEDVKCAKNAYILKKIIMLYFAYTTTIFASLLYKDKSILKEISKKIAYISLGTAVSLSLVIFIKPSLFSDFSQIENAKNFLKPSALISIAGGVKIAASIFFFPIIAFYIITLSYNLFSRQEEKYIRILTPGFLFALLTGALELYLIIRNNAIENIDVHFSPTILGAVVLAITMMIAVIRHFVDSGIKAENTYTDLKRSEQKFEILAENIDEVFWLIDKDNFKLLYISPTYEKVWERKTDVLYASLYAWIKYVHPDDREGLKHFLETDINEEVQANYRIETHDGRTKWINDKTKRIKDSENNEEYIIRISRDVSKIVEMEKERQKQEAILLQADKLGSLGRLYAGIAHEINQPLTGISMAAENILDGLTESVLESEYVIKKMDNIISYSERIRKIIEHIKLFSREESGKKHSRINVHETIKNAFELIRVQYESRGINLIEDFSGEPVFIFGNIYKFEQIILNLVNNAKDALLSKELNRQKEIIVRSYVQNKYVFIEIIDNGSGINTKEISKIFEPFYTTKEPGKGTGLGLSITYGIIKEMKGNIFAESEEGEYTSFTVSFPNAKN